MKIEEVLKQVTQTLKNKGFESPQTEAEIITGYALKIDKVNLHTQHNRIITDNEAQTITNLLERRLKHEPLQYLTSRAFFYGLEFIIEPPILIPRPETETLIETILKMAKDISSPKIVEIGTGSGIIAITLLKHLPSAIVYATDIIKPTLAQRNAKIHSVNNRVHFIEADLLSAINIQADFIVSNPPYIPTSVIPTLQEEVRTFESKLALDGGKDGLSVIRKIIENAPEHLNENGVLILEFSPEQRDTLEQEAKKRFKNIEFINDLSGKTRVVVCRDSQ
ncbi:MAG: peptide chain release factor N(5)-glutamine methyltransferase [bacterium]|nr:peptide chain release factor N(5)-glutamine methyltransferase [bacterium]